MHRLADAYAKSVLSSARVSDDHLAEVLRRTPREQFFPPGPWWIYQFEPTFPYFSYHRTRDGDVAHLYENVSVAIDADGFVNSGLPSAIAQWLAAADIQAGTSVFQVGCGFGYFTAILAELVGPSGSVQAVEVRKDVGRLAQKNLRGWGQVRVMIGDGGAIDPGKVDVIIVHAGVTEIPEQWLDRLNVGGRLIVPLTFIDPRRPELGLGIAFLITRQSDGRYSAQVLNSPYITTCTSNRTGNGLAFRDALERGGWDKVASLRRDPHTQDDRCWLHQDRWCLSKVPVSSAAPRPLHQSI